MDKVNQRLLAEIQMEDIPENCRRIAEKMGLEIFAEITYHFGGIPFYFPKFESVAAPARDRIIKKEFNGGNYKELASKYNITEVWVRQIVNTARVEQSQVNLFEE